MVSDILYVGEPNRLLASGEETLDVAAAGADDEAMAAVRALDGVSGVTRDGDELVVNCDSDAKTEVIAALEDAGVAVADFHTREASLEDLFLAYTEGDAPGEEREGGSDDDAADAEEVDR